MGRRLMMLTVFVLFGATALIPRAADDAPGLSERVTLSLRAVSTPPGGASEEVASGGPALRVGEQGSFYFLTGDPERPESELCGSSVGSPDPDPAQLARSAHAWLGQVQLVDATMDAIRFRVDWSRQDATADGLERVGGDQRIVTLREGEAHTLDFLDVAGSSDCGVSMRIDVAANVVEDRALAGTRLRHELWLVDTAPGREPVSRRVEMTSRQGERVDFTIEPLRWPLEGGDADAEPRFALAVITGTLRARLRPDESIEAVLDARSAMRIGTGVAGESGGIGGRGRKVLRFAEGETLALVLPPARGVHVVGLDGTWASVYGAPGMTSTAAESQAVSWRDTSVAVDFGKLLEGHELSLRLRTRRVENR